MTTNVFHVPSLQTEAQIQAGIIEYLRRTGWLVLELRGNAKRGGPVYQTKGTPDLYALRKGRSIWLEIKRPDQHPTPEQAALHEIMRAQGVEVYVVRDLDALLEITCIQKAIGAI